MNCPSCHKELPENISIEKCPFCGTTLVPGIPARQVHQPRHFQARLFFCGLLAPPLLTLITAFLMRTFVDKSNESVSVAVGSIGSVIGGIICGVTIGILPRDIGARVICSIVMIAIMSGVCLVLSCFGCTMGGYQLNLH
jgi:hypothetical protein